MAGLDIQFQKIQNVPEGSLALLSGAIDGNTIHDFQGALDEIQKKGVSKLILDFSQVKYVNSTGLGSLVKYADSFKQAGGGVSLMKVPAKVKIVIEMLGLNAFFEMCANQEEALASINKATAPAGPKNITAPRQQPSSRKSTRTAAPETVQPPSAGSSPAVPVATAPSSSASAPPSKGNAGAIPVTCSSCNLEMDLPSNGNFQCPRCFTLISASSSGQVTFHVPNKAQPVTMILNCTPACTQAFRFFLAGLSRAMGFPEPIAQGFEHLALEIGEIMSQHVYGGNESASYHVLIESNNGKFQIRLSDYGKVISPNLVGSLFRKTQQVMNEFQCTPHPKGGNIINMARKR